MHLMKSFKALALVALLSAAAFAQTNTIRSTTLGAAISTTQQTVITVASATNINAPSPTVTGTMLYVENEAMLVTAVSGTSISVRRGHQGTAAATHVTGALVLHGNPNWFYASDPYGSCTAASTYVTPWVNTKTGNQWLCSSVTGSWVPGFGNVSAPAQPTAAVASAAGLVTPSGPLFHVTGTNAITGFTLPLGFSSGTICAIPDALWTTTNATNLALGTAAVVNRQLCWTYDSATAKFYPSY